MSNQNPQYGQLGQPTGPQIDDRQRRIMNGEPPKSGKGKKIAAWVGAVVAALFVGAAIAPDSTESAPVVVSAAPKAPAVAAAAPTTGWLAPTTTRSVPIVPAAPAPAKQPTGYKQDKLLKIGVDIQPGTYTYEVPEDTIMAGFVFTCTVGADCNDAISADSSDMFSVGESGEYVVPDYGYIKLDDVYLTPVS